jgi:hypothetical protein
VAKVEAILRQFNKGIDQIEAKIGGKFRKKWQQNPLLELDLRKRKKIQGKNF